MPLLARWALVAIITASVLSAQLSGNWVSNGAVAKLIDPYGNSPQFRPLTAGDYVLRGERAAVIAFHNNRRGLSISDTTSTITPLPSLGIAIEPDRSQQIWVIRENNRAVEAYDYKGKLQRTATLPGQPTSFCLTGKSELWVCQQNSPAAALSWFDTSTPNSTVKLITLPRTFGAATKMVADIPQGGTSTLWLINDQNDQLLEMDDLGQVIASHKVGTEPGEKNRDVFLDNRGDLWILTTKALYEWQPATQKAKRERWTDQSKDFFFDPGGRLWQRETWRLTSYRPGNLRPEHEINGSFYGNLSHDVSGLYRAMIINPTGDTDGDGEENLAEIQRGTDPYDSSSSTSIDLRLAKSTVELGGNIEMNLLGSTYPSVLLVALGDASQRIVIPGIAGDLRLYVPSISPATFAVPFTGQINIPVPNNPPLGFTKLSFQAFSSRGNRLSNHVSVQLHNNPLITDTESFVTTSKRDKVSSGGTWQSGSVTPGQLGGNGRLGRFDYELGQKINASTFVWNTDNMTIPGSHTLFGNPQYVTDGRFDFTSFSIPKGITVIFEGSNPAIIRVRGSVKIDGTLQANGHDVPADYNGKASGIINSTPSLGQDPTPGGPGGGAGGRGAIGHVGAGPGAGPKPEYNGQDGDDVTVPGSSGYSGLVLGTGGPGSSMFPASGLNTSLIWNYGTFPADYSAQTASGGGGGGFLGAGMSGKAIQSLSGQISDLGPSAPGGIAMAYIPIPPGGTALDHFLLGGSGGGGSGSHALAIQRNLIKYGYPWHGGGAGAGGGGALAFQAGGDFTVGTAGLIEVRGGNGDPNLGGNRLMSFGQFPPSPGGAGSGGSILVQVDGTSIFQAGTIDVRGGARGKHRTRGPLLSGNTLVDSGDGAPGFVRMEHSRMTALAVGKVSGINVNQQNWSTQVHATPDWSGCQTTWYHTSLSYPASFAYYELDVRINGNLVTYTDDPTRYNPANQPGNPVQLYLQGRFVTPANSQPTPWRVQANGTTNSLTADQANEYRFMLLFDPTVSQNVAVEEFRLVYN